MGGAPPARQAGTDRRHRLRSLHPRPAACEAFEEEAAAALGVAHGIGVANGTDALVLALRAARRGARRRGDLPVVHVLRHGRGDRRGRRRPGVRRHRAPNYNLDPGRGRRGRSRRAPAPSSPCTCSAIRPTWRRCGALRPARPRPASRTPRRRSARARRRHAARSATWRRSRSSPRRTCRRFGDGGLITTPRDEVADTCRDAALPRLEGQADVHADRLQLAPRRAAGGRPARVPPRPRRLERGPPAAAARYARRSGLDEHATLPRRRRRQSTTCTWLAWPSASASSRRAGPPASGAASTTSGRCICSRCSRDLGRSAICR